MNQPITSIRYPFAIDRQLGVLMEEKDFSQHVKQMIMQVLLTSPGERINRPDFGCGLRRLVFAPNSETSANLMQVTVVQTLEKWLGDLIEVSEVKVKAIEEKLELGVIYVLKARQERQYLNLEVTL
jgi:phage baseplate assembly protein W